MNFKSKNGITLIALVITIIVLLILAGVSISSLVGNNGVATKAKTAAEKFNHSKSVELESLDDMSTYIASASRVRSTEWVGTSSGKSGKLTLPVALNDCSKQYILTVESELFTGEVCVNVYGLSGTFTAVSGVDAENSYMAEIRHLIYADVDALFAEEGITSIKYQSDGTEHVLSYDPELLGSELVVTKIQSIDKEYTGFASIFAKVIREEELTYADVLDCVKFCIKSENLGYTYLNEQIASSGDTEGEAFDEALEMEFLRDAYYNQAATYETLEATILDESALLMQVSIIKAMQFVELSTGLSLEGLDPFTIVDYIAENEYLNEYYTRTLGNSVVPFTLIFKDAMIKDLNEDGSLNTTTNFSLYNYVMLEIYPDTGLAGLQYRMFADLFAVIGPVMENAESGEISELQNLQLQEVFFAMEASDDNTNDSMYGYYFVYAEHVISIYNKRKLDDFFTMILESGQDINVSGVRIAFNSFILPDSIGHSMGIIGDYNFLSDTEHIKKQGIEGIKDELNAFIEAALVEEEETTE